MLFLFSLVFFFFFFFFFFFVLHDYYDINHVNIIFFVFVGLYEKVFAIPQLSPKYIP